MKKEVVLDLLLNRIKLIINTSTDIMIARVRDAVLAEDNPVKPYPCLSAEEQRVPYGQKKQRPDETKLQFELRRAFQVFEEEVNNYNDMMIQDLKYADLIPDK